jgi:hypothetical protein
MVTRNPNWSTEIIWYGTSYVKEKILSPFKRPTWDKLHCWFCLKLLIICSPLFFFFYNIPDSDVSECLLISISDSGVGKYYTNSESAIFLTLAQVNKFVKFWIFKEEKKYSMPFLPFFFYYLLFLDKNKKMHCTTNLCLTVKVHK